MICFLINQLESHTNNISPYEMQKVRRTRRESIIKREANISIFASQKNPGFLETPQRRKKGMK